MGSHGTEIKRLNDDSVRRIVAEQAITDLSSIVKELVDNALDAESATIKIRLFEQGLDIVEVSDDGTGVPPESRPHLAERYATSKISSFEDIYSGTGLTMGFRGEALFSMACLSSKLVVATRTEDEETAQKMEFGKDGKLDSTSVQNIHRKIGTTVAVVQPFAALPARRVDMMRRIRAERSKLFRLMESYAIFNVGVQFNLIDMSSSGREDVALATSATSTKLEDTVSSVLGHKLLATLAPLDLTLDQMLKHGENEYNWGIKGLISKNPKGDMPNRAVSFYSINGRVVEVPKISSVLRRVWNGFGGKKKPSCILSFTLPNDAFDINLSPDKQQVLLTQEQEICQLVEEHITQFWSSQTQGVFELQQLEGPVEEENAEVEEDGERQMHKRRFAFVHDITKAKMQHDSDDRQRCAGGDEKNQPESEAGDNNSNIDTVDGPASKKAKISYVNVAAPSESNSIASSPLPDVEPAPPVERISDMERRQWTAARSKFNSGDSKVEISDMSPMTPEYPSQSDVPHRNGDRTSRNLSDTKQKLPGREKPMESTKNGRQLSLQQFAFQLVEGSIRRTKNGSDVGIRHEVSKRVHEKLALAVPGRSDRSTVGEVGRHNTHHVRDSATRRESGVTTEEEDLSPSGGEEPNSPTGPLVPSPRSSDEKPPPADMVNVFDSTRPESIIWTTFKGTEEVCRASRLDRVQTTQRRLGLRVSKESSMNNRRNIDKDAEAVTNSVGVSNAPNATHISLSKDQFQNEMQVIGQFNMGFILARCKRNHLWILDQHACDEKYNFENLCRDTIIHEQTLLKPMPLDMSPAEEACILDNMNIFEANGFRFRFDSSAPIRHRLSLTGLPHSGARDGRKAVQFGKDDVSTLCTILMDGSSYDAGDGGTGTDGSGRYGNNAVRRHASTASSQFDTADRIIARLPKAIAMFASRACRSSIMIGTALSKKEMERIVRRLADIEQPWNCPHGRPTMRHVGEVLSSFQRDERIAAEYITDPTVTCTPMTQEPTGDEDREN